MIEVVSPRHPDKIVDRVCGAIVDLAYKETSNPRIAIEALIGHRKAVIIAETSVTLDRNKIKKIVKRIAGDVELEYIEVPQDPHLSNNQEGKIRCGDNGIFKGVPLRKEDKELARIARQIYFHYPYDGKYILDGDKLIICQSHAKTSDLQEMFPNAIINPLGDWTGGTDVDCGAVNRKLGSDMGQSLTGGGLHGKDLSKADVAINIYAFMRAQDEGKVVELSCAIGDEEVDGKEYSEIVCIAKDYIDSIGGFEKLAEWGLY